MTYFRLCSTCKKQIAFEQTWYRCSVSTCNRGNTALFFCSVECWSAHVPVLKHRDAWAEQQTAPAPGASPSAAPAPAPTPAPQTGDLPRDVLVVVSKLKTYVRERSGFNTSDGVTEVLSDHLRELCTQAIRVAAAEGRKTVMERDFRAVLKSQR